MEDLASIIIVIYNSRRYIKTCIDSILEQDYPYEIIAVDNNSTDDSCQIFREKYPWIKLIESPENTGYGVGNNEGVKHARGKYIVVINPDTIVEKGWLRGLIEPIKGEGKIITTPKILTYNGDSINTCGAINHFSGLTFTRGLGAKTDAQSKEMHVSGFSGCSFAIRKDYYLKLGGFDSSFFMYNEDADFSWRANLKGFRILYVPNSVIKHDYSLDMTPKKLYYLEKGRYTILRKYLSFYCLLLLTPSLIITEVLTFGYASRQGLRFLLSKILALIHGLSDEVTPIKGNSQQLIGSLYCRIPDDQLTKYKADSLFIKFCNKIYTWNYACLRAIRMPSTTARETYLKISKHI